MEGLQGDFISKLAAILTAVAAILGALYALADKLLSLRSSSVINLVRSKLSQDDQERVLRALRHRTLVILGLVFILAVVFGLATFLYFFVFPSPVELSAGFAFSSVDQIRLDEEWLIENPVLLPAISDLFPASPQDRRAPARQGHPEVVVQLMSAPFGSVTKNHPITPTRRELRYSPDDYLFDPPYVLLARDSAAGIAFESLVPTVEPGKVAFDIPASGPKDYLLVIGRLTRKANEPFPKDLGNIFQMRQSQ